MTRIRRPFLRLFQAWCGLLGGHVWVDPTLDARVDALVGWHDRWKAGDSDEPLPEVLFRPLNPTQCCVCHRGRHV
jgi:hypothetical protein